MKVISHQMNDYIQKSSWIRRMFEAGAELKAKYGSDKVFDFSLGNPDLAPPPSVKEGLMKIAKSIEKPFSMGYMPNAGYLDVREKLAKYLSKEQKVSLKPSDIMMTCGAAGGINAFFKTVLEPGDEVLCPAPYFVEYGFYAQNHQGVLVPVFAKLPDFSLDVQEMTKHITDKTRVVLINSPNNPTGQVYSKKELESLITVLRRKVKEVGKPIYLVSDEPYRFLVYDKVKVPALLGMYEYAVVINSYSKSLSLAGERIGYVALNPSMPGNSLLMNGLVLSNRILGFVNAPALGQRLLYYSLGSQVDVSIYAKRRATMADVLSKAGYTFSMPKGGFYFFVEAPGKDDVAFVAKLQKQKILAVPGAGFGFPGYFRLTFCIDAKIISNALPAFKAALKK